MSGDPGLDDHLDNYGEPGIEPSRDETLREAIDRITAEADRLGAFHLIAGVDQLEARLRDERNRVLGVAPYTDEALYGRKGERP